MGPHSHSCYSAVDIPVEAAEADETGLLFCLMMDGVITEDIQTTWFTGG